MKEAYILTEDSIIYIIFTLKNVARNFIIISFIMQSME